MQSIFPCYGAGPEHIFQRLWNLYRPEVYKRKTNEIPVGILRGIMVYKFILRGSRPELPISPKVDILISRSKSIAKEIKKDERKRITQQNRRKKNWN